MLRLSGADRSGNSGREVGSSSAAATTAAAFSVSVKPVFGAGPAVYVDNLRPSDTVQTLKERLVEDQGWPYTFFGFFRGGALALDQDDQALSACGIGNQSEILYLLQANPLPQYREGARFHHLLLEKDSGISH